MKLMKAPPQANGLMAKVKF